MRGFLEFMLALVVFIAGIAIAFIGLFEYSRWGQ